jgi:uncharacterized coiled-coil protein SlyX
MPKLEDLEARVAALEASRADYRAVLSAINAVGANQRDMVDTLRGHDVRLRSVEGKVDTLSAKVDDTNQRVRALEESSVEIKELLVRALDR